MALQLDTRIAGSNPAGLVVPRLLLSPSAWSMICAYVAAADKTEVSGFAYVRQLVTDPGVPTTFYVSTSNDVFIVPQEVTVGSVEVSGSNFALAAHRSLADGRDDDLRLQWHSHPNESYFSATDLGNIAGFGDAGMEWFISLVTNRHNEVHARFDQFRPFRIGAEMDVYVYDFVPDDIFARAEDDVAEMVTIVKPKKLVAWPVAQQPPGSSLVISVED